MMNKITHNDQAKQLPSPFLLRFLRKQEEEARANLGLKANANVPKELQKHKSPENVKKSAIMY